MPSWFLGVALFKSSNRFLFVCPRRSAFRIFFVYSKLLTLRIISVPPGFFSFWLSGVLTILWPIRLLPVCMWHGPTWLHDVGLGLRTFWFSVVGSKLCPPWFGAFCPGLLAFRFQPLFAIHGTSRFSDVDSWIQPYGLFAVSLGFRSLSFLPFSAKHVPFWFSHVGPGLLASWLFAVPEIIGAHRLCIFTHAMLAFWILFVTFRRRSVGFHFVLAKHGAIRFFHLGVGLPAVRIFNVSQKFRATQLFSLYLGLLAPRLFTFAAKLRPFRIHLLGIWMGSVWFDIVGAQLRDIWLGIFTLRPDTPGILLVFVGVCFRGIIAVA